MFMMFEDKIGISIKDVFPNPTDEQLMIWKDICNSQKQDTWSYLDWNLDYYRGVCIKLIKEEFDELYKNFLQNTPSSHSITH